MANHIRLFHAVMVLTNLRLCAYSSEPLLLENESVNLVFSAPKGSVYRKRLKVIKVTHNYLECIKCH